MVRSASLVRSACARCASDLNAVMAIEVRGYPFPWTRGIFVDCLRAGYPGLAMGAMAS